MTGAEAEDLDLELGMKGNRLGLGAVVSHVKKLGGVVQETSGVLEQEDAAVEFILLFWYIHPVGIVGVG